MNGNRQSIKIGQDRGFSSSHRTPTPSNSLGDDKIFRKEWIPCRTLPGETLLHTCRAYFHFVVSQSNILEGDQNLH